MVALPVSWRGDGISLREPFPSARKNGALRFDPAGWSRRSLSIEHPIYQRSATA
jgi:hypothetical protein